VRSPIKLFVTALLLFLVTAAALTAQQTPAPAAGSTSSAIQKSVEAYLRNLYAFGPDVAITVGAPKETNIPGLLEAPIDVTIEGNKQSVKFYVSKDGKYLLRGELSDLTRDPLVENRAKLEIKDAPATGDPNAPITIVEFADFECPVCRNLHDALHGILAIYPQVRLVFKDFPLEQHPWARSAAIAGRCAYNQDPKAFWKLYDLIYDNQEIISAENSYSKFLDYASQSGLDADAFKSCVASPEAAAVVEASRANGTALLVSSTPTLFIDGRPLVGADPHAIEQSIKYELALQRNKH
jgi:protein-disulfide isomerase